MTSFHNQDGRIVNQGHQTIGHQTINGYGWQTKSTKDITDTCIDSGYTESQVYRLCLESLHCPDSLKVKNRLKFNKDRLLKEAIEWIPEQSQYTKWIDGDSDISLLLITGGAGKGKTMASIGLIEKLSQKPKATAYCSVVVTYFFCQNADPELNTVESIVKGLIRRLVEQRKEAQSPLRQLWDNTNQCVRSDNVSLHDIWDILLAVLEQCTCDRVYIVIDGLDECLSTGLADLLQLISRTGLSHPWKVKWLLTSRPMDAAEQVLLVGPEHKWINLQLESINISLAVKMYISQRVGELNRKHRYGNQLCQQLEYELVSKAEATFLWVSLVCKQLEDVIAQKALATVQDIPSGLNALYARSFRALEQDIFISKQCIRLLEVSILCFRPLHEDEIESVAGFSNDEPINRQILEKCAAFVTMNDGVIEFVHQSARDYLKGPESPLEIGVQYGHPEVALSALGFLSINLKYNILDLPQLNSTWEPTEDRYPAVLSRLDYAATFWMDHLLTAVVSHGPEHILGANRQLERFLEAKFLEWLECLSLLHKLDMAVETLQTFVTVVEADRVYYSAMVFTPTYSSIKRKNASRTAWWLKWQSSTNDVWSPILQTLTIDQYLTSAAFSADGKLIAGGCMGGDIIIWHVLSGTRWRTLKLAISHESRVKEFLDQQSDYTQEERHFLMRGSYWQTVESLSFSRVESLSFSPDGTHLASVHFLGTILLWTIASGDYQILSLGRSFKIAFSRSGRYLAFVGGHLGIKIWDIAPIYLKRTLRWPEGLPSVRILHLVFSPDDKQVASNCEGGVVLWSTIDGSVRHILKGYHVRAISFSYDGSQIVTFCDTSLLTIWDANTGEKQKERAIFMNSFGSDIALSPQGTDLAWITSNGLHLWSVFENRERMALPGVFAEGGESRLIFSSDGKQLAVRNLRSFTSSINLIDLTIGKYTQPTRSAFTASWNSVLKFSPDGTKFVSASANRLKFWNAVTGNCISSSDHSIIGFPVLDFSPDSSILLIARQRDPFDTSIVEIRDAATNLRTWQDLRVNCFRIVKLACSPDKKLVGIADISAIEIWDASIGRRIQMIGLNSQPVDFAFSPTKDELALITCPSLDYQRGNLKVLSFNRNPNHITSSYKVSQDRCVEVLSTESALCRDLDFAREDFDLLCEESHHHGRYVESFYRRLDCLLQPVNLRYSADGNTLSTNSWSVSTALSPGQRPIVQPRLVLSLEHGWIKYGDRFILKLPPYFLCHLLDNKVVVGLDGGTVHCFEIDVASLLAG